MQTQHKFDKNLEEQYLIRTSFLTSIIISLFYSFPKGVDLNEHMDDCEKFNETSLSEKEDFYSHLNMEDITDADYTHTKRVCKDIEIKI